MGQTLTHGVYLPDEGERNCYSGLAANWQILDSSVGTIAAHTAALAGKAPAVHTHTKSDITDFPAYGNTAGTICEGNDSRLSDARTPVAHTHTKSNITDLFNSANVWSADQTTTGAYYVKSTTWEKGVEPSSSSHKNIYFADKNNISVGTIRRRIANGSQSFQFFGSALIKDGQLDPTGDNVTWGFSQVFLSNGSTYFQFDGNIGNSIVPRLNNTYDLGSSTLKWKTLNGVNPGALSLPDYSNAQGLDVSAQGLNWDLTGATSNSYTPTFDGYLSLRCKDTNGDFLFAAYGGNNAIIRNCAVGTGILPGNAGLCLLMPMQANTAISIQAKATANFKAYVIPCFGNV